MINCNIFEKISLIIRKKYSLIILILILIVQVVIRLSLSLPIDMDEGIYSYFGQRIIEGEVPYRDVFDHKVPGIFFIYALILKLFSQSLISIRLVALLFTLLTTILVFLIAKLTWNRSTGLLAALLHAIFINGSLIQGTTANTEIFINFFSILSLWLFFLSYKNDKRKSLFLLLFLSGCFAGLSFMIKPVALFNFLPILFFSFFIKKSVLKKFFYLGLGFLIFPLIFSFYFIINKAFLIYFSSAFLINNDYIAANRSIFVDPLLNIQKGWLMTKVIALKENLILWLLALSGIIYIFIKKRTRDNYFFVLYFFFSFLGIATGGPYIFHYFIQIIPALCFLSAYFLTDIFQSKVITKAKLIFKIIAGGLIFILILIFILKYYYVEQPQWFQFFNYQYSKDIEVISNYLREKIKPSDSIFIWPRTPEIYLYTQKKSASRFIFYPSWAEEKLNIKENILADLEKNKPSFIIIDPFVKNDPFLQLDNFIKKYYQPDDGSPWPLIYQWKIYKLL